jgi:hypothetical protein
LFAQPDNSFDCPFCSMNLSGVHGIVLLIPRYHMSLYLCKAIYLSASIRGESRHRYVRKEEVGYWGQRAAARKKFIQAMAAWVKVNKEIEKALRKIGRLRCGPLPGGRSTGKG